MTTSRVRALLPEILQDSRFRLIADVNPARVSVGSTDTGIGVVTMRNHDGDAAIVVKIATTPGTARGLEMESRHLALLNADERLAGMRSLLPEVLFSGNTEAWAYSAQRALPGVAADTFVRDEIEGKRATAAALEAGRRLHRLTKAETFVDDRLAASWIERPAAAVRAALERRHPGILPRLRNLTEVLEGAFRARTFVTGWIHGDLCLGNVLVDQEGSIATGLVDWDRASAQHLPAVDELHLALYTRAVRERRELGDVVREMLLTPAPDNVAVPTITEDSIHDPELFRPMLLAYWLHHVGANLEGAEESRAIDRWIRRNVLPVLRVA